MKKKKKKSKIFIGLCINYVGPYLLVDKKGEVAAVTSALVSKSAAETNFLHFYIIKINDSQPAPGAAFSLQNRAGPARRICASGFKASQRPEHSRMNGKKIQRGAGEERRRRARREGQDGARRGRGTARSPWRICRPGSTACGPRCPPSPRDSGRALRAVMVRTGQ